MKCDFRTITKKDIFKAKLSGEPIHFGFIPVWRLKKFVQFCLKNKFMVPLENNSIGNPWHNAHMDFVYESTYSFTSFRPLAHLMTWLSDIVGHRFTPMFRPFRTGRQTIDCGPSHPGAYYVIRKNMYIS